MAYDILLILQIAVGGLLCGIGFKVVNYAFVNSDKLGVDAGPCYFLAGLGAIFFGIFLISGVNLVYFGVLP